jgi:hypothetical protein
MKLTRVLLVGLLTVALAAPAAADDRQSAFAKSIQNQAQAAAAPPPPARMSRAIMWPALALFAGGMGVATYGYLHTSDGEFVEPGDIGEVSRPRLAASGLVAAAAGGALLFWGTQRARHAPTILISRGGMSVKKKVTW